jgi:hypothetical protein
MIMRTSAGPEKPIRGHNKISGRKGLDYYTLKQHKPWFREEF